MTKQYAGRRKRLKEMAKDEALPPEERFKARLKLSELPRNSSPGRVRSRCLLTGAHVQYIVNLNFPGSLYASLRQLG
jgi:small subunit ribosomal protein S14